MSRLLIVEDDCAVALTFARMLRLEGYEVRIALDARAALDEMEASHPDALIVDLRMPFMDGVTFVRRLRSDANLCRVPIAIITGDYAVDAATAHELSALDACLHFKPLWLEDLVGIIRRLLDGAP
jgi:two-component system response regulator MprA